MKTWIFGEYLSLPFVLCDMYRENIRKTQYISRQKIRFGKDKYQYILVFKPVKAAMRKKHTVFFIHGGGWAAGSAEGFAFIGNFFAEQGFNTILGGYRHAPKYKHPAQIEDVYKGLAAGLRVLEEQGIKSDKVIAAGQSAGAQLAGLLALDEENAGKHGIDPGIFSAMVLISGPLDFSTCEAKQIKLGLHGFLDNKEAYTEADPIRLANEHGGMPVLCIHGGKDPIVDIKNSIGFYNWMKGGFEGISRLMIAEDKHHIELLRMFMRNTEETKVLLSFLNKIEKM